MIVERQVIRVDGGWSIQCTRYFGNCLDSYGISSNAYGWCISCRQPHMSVRRPQMSEWCAMDLHLPGITQQVWPINFFIEFGEVP